MILRTLILFLGLHPDFLIICCMFQPDKMAVIQQIGIYNQTNITLKIQMIRTKAYFQSHKAHVQSNQCTTTYLGIPKLRPLLTGVRCPEVHFCHENVKRDQKIVVADGRWSPYGCGRQLKLNSKFKRVRIHVMLACVY